jgi:hypothetical protein
MARLFFFFSLGSSWLLINGCRPHYTFSTADPLEHYQYVEDEVNRIGKTILDFAGVAATPQTDCRLLGEYHQKTVQALAASEEKLRGVEPLPRFEGFRAAALELAAFHHSYIRDLYRRWVELRCKQNATQEELQELERIGRDYRDRLYPPDNAYQEARARFVADNGLPVFFPHIEQEDYRYMK